MRGSGSADSHNGSHTRGFRAPGSQVREAGLLNRRFGYYGVMISLTVAAFGVGFAGLVLVGNSWWALGIAAFLGLAFTQLGFVGHDAGHTRSSAPDGPTGCSGSGSGTC